MRADDFLPEPPREMVAPQTIETVMTVGVGSVLALMVVAVVVACVRGRTPLYLLILLGGGICMFNEPLLDIIGHVWFPSNGDWQAFSTLGRPIPVWVALAYFAYFGGLTAATVWALRRGCSRRQIWAGIATIEALNCLLEIPPLKQDLYVYYGEQPLRIAGEFPAVWLVFNCAGSFLAATIIFRALPYLRGPRLALVVLVPPICQHAAFWLGVPYVAAINSDVAHGWMIAAALLTFALGLGLMHLLVDAVADRGERPTAPTASPPETTAVRESAGRESVVPQPALRR